METSTPTDVFVPETGDYTQAVTAYADMLYRIALHHVKSVTDAEDVVQDVFIRLLQQGNCFVNEEHRKAWLIRVAINRAHDITRAARQKNLPLTQAIAENLMAQSDIGTTAETVAASELLELVQTLPEHYRNAIYLFYYEGYTAAEVGKLLGAPSNTVLSWLRRGRKLLEALLQEDFQ